MNNAQYDQETGKPLDQSYLECGLPDDLQASIQEMQKSWAIIDGGSRDPHWDSRTDYFSRAGMVFA